MDLSKLKELLTEKKEGLPAARDIESIRAFKDIFGAPQYDANLGDLKLSEAQNKPTYYDKPVTQDEIGQMLETMPMAGIGKVGKVVDKTVILKALQEKADAEKLAKLKKFLAGSNTLGAENTGQVFKKLPKKEFGRTLVTTDEKFIPNYGKVTVRP